MSVVLIAEPDQLDALKARSEYTDAQAFTDAETPAALEAIITGRPDWTLMECSQVMQEKHIHHLPIADESGALIGIISATDIFTAVEESGWEETE